MTTTIDYIDATVFPRAARSTIGVRDGSTFYRATCSPLCSFYPDTTFDRPQRAISERYKEPPPNGVPGPGKYDPTPIAARNPSYSLAGPKYRDEWLVDVKNSPAPDCYNPVKPKRELPRWSIGERSRPGRSALNRKEVFALGQFLVRLPEDMTVEEARAFSEKHPELRDTVNMVLSLVQDEKPDEPVEYLREFFQDRQKERKDVKKEGNEPGRLIVHYGTLRRT
jgi:hypothetical protein